MDTPTDSNGALDVTQAGAAFANMLEPITPVDDSPPVDTEIDAAKAEPTEPESVAQEDDPTVPIVIDGKTVDVKLSDLKAGYQKDKASTERFMAASALSKTAQAEVQKAQQERQEYAHKLNSMASQLESVLTAQSQVDMNALLESDPVEYLKQQHLANQRQAQLQQINQQRGRIQEQMQADHAKAHQSYLAEQSQALLDKLPAWRDEAKAKAERAALQSYLKSEGYSDDAISGVSDHKAVIMARKAMLYDQMITKATAATKKVAALPQKVERPGVAENGNLDRRGALFQKLSKSGSVEDAGKLFASMF